MFAVAFANATHAKVNVNEFSWECVKKFAVPIAKQLASRRTLTTKRLRKTIQEMNPRKTR